MANDFCLHPDIIDVVVEDLLASDIINKAEVDKLKNDTSRILDPNLVMDIRHKEVKKESLINFDNGTNGKLAQKRNMDNISLGMFSNTKDLKTIDKEIANTKRKLEMFQHQLVKRNESLTNTIYNLEKEREQNTSSPVVVNLNKDETKHYFNLHLDSLESEVIKDLRREKVKTWKPFELKPPPVINVITTLKVVDIKHSVLQFAEEDTKLSEVCNIKPIHVSGKMLQGALPEIQKSVEAMRDFVPNNTPSLDTVDTPTFELLEASKPEENKIVRHVLNTWKLYVKTKHALKLGEENRKRSNVNLLKRHFISWMMYAKSCKKKREVNCFSVCNQNEEVYPLQNTNCIEIDRAIENKCLDLQQQTEGLRFLAHSFSKCEKETKVCSEQTSRNSQINIKKKNEMSADNLKTITKIAVIPKINFVTPETVKMPSKNKSKSKLNIKKNEAEIKATRLTSNVLSKPIQEPLQNRYAAQEKIITQQSAMIEKQKQIILDLKAQYFTAMSKINLKTAQSELAKSPAVCDKKLKPVVKTVISEATSGVPKSTNTNADQSEILTKRLLERQNYCKQLAEMTKLRKKRIEEEKTKQKLEE